MLRPSEVDYRNMTITYEPDGVPITLKGKYEICTTCRGKGTHVNRNIDGNGISTDDECWQDDDFREMYFSGGYDVHCEDGCNDGKVLVPDPLCNTAAEIEVWEQYSTEWYREEASDRYTRWAESGYPQ